MDPLAQARALAVVRRADGHDALLQRMTERLDTYRAGRPWRQPWPPDDPIFQRPRDASPPPPR